MTRPTQERLAEIRRSAENHWYDQGYGADAAVEDLLAEIDALTADGWPCRPAQPGDLVTDIADFITARYATIEQTACDAGTTRSGTIATWHIDCDCPDETAGIHLHDCDARRIEGAGIIIYDEGGHDEDQARHIVMHDPPAVLADLKAKRGLLALAAEMRRTAAGNEASELSDWADRIEAGLAAPYTKHPDFNHAWTPA